MYSLSGLPALSIGSTYGQQIGGSYSLSQPSDTIAFGLFKKQPPSPKAPAGDAAHLIHNSIKKETEARRGTYNVGSHLGHYLPEAQDDAKENLKTMAEKDLIRFISTKNYAEIETPGEIQSDQHFRLTERGFEEALLRAQEVGSEFRKKLATRVGIPAGLVILAGGAGAELTGALPVLDTIGSAASSAYNGAASIANSGLELIGLGSEASTATSAPAAPAPSSSAAPPAGGDPSWSYVKPWTWPLFTGGSETIAPAVSDASSPDLSLDDLDDLIEGITPAEKPFLDLDTVTGGFGDSPPTLEGSYIPDDMSEGATVKDPDWLKELKGESTAPSSTDTLDWLKSLDDPDWMKATKEGGRP